MATKQEYLDAANKQPKDRSGSEQDLVEKGRNMQEVRNADHHSAERQRTGR